MRVSLVGRWQLIALDVREKAAHGVDVA